MKNKSWLIILLSVIALSLIAFVFYPKLSKTLSKGGKDMIDEKAPDFTVYDTKMNPISLSDLSGKPMVLNFWASWCGPCRMELPAFNNLYKKYGEEVVFMMINLDDGDLGEVKNFLSEKGYDFPVYYDLNGRASLAYSVSSIPETVFITADGKVFNTHVGTLSEWILEIYIKRILE